ncbi:MAG: TylF/MycF/NovP-related O-methyltransferase [Verrucomicrobiota bacterium]
MTASVKNVLKKVLYKLGYELYGVPRQWQGDAPIPDLSFYRPFFSPWLGYGAFAGLYKEAAPFTLVPPERCWVLFSLARQALNLPGDFAECGVYKGGTAMLLSRVASQAPPPGKKLLLFDSFSGMLQTDASKDLHQPGHFADTSLEAVQQRVSWFHGAEFHQGWIPESFRGVEPRRFSFVHIDVDLHQSVLDCCEFIYPRLSPGGFMVFDDYGLPSCPGARRAVDTFFDKRPEVPLVLANGQAVVFKQGA